MDASETMLIEIKTEISAVRTDVAWLKKLFGGCLIVCGALIGVDVSGVL